MSSIGVATPRAKRGANRKLGEYLIAEGVISDDQLKRALDRQIANGGFLGETLVDLGYLTPKQLRPHLERVTGFGFVDLTEVEIDQNWTSKLPESYVVSTSALPFAERDGKVLVAMADPLNVSLVDDLRTKLQRPVVALLALQSDIKEAISRTYDVRSRTMDLLAGLRQNNEVDADDNVDEAALEDQAERAPIVRLVGEILKSAMASGASDIHVEPQEDDVRVRFRIDGVLYDQMSIPMEYLPAVVSRLKVMSSLDIAERRRPQDGRFGYKDEVGNAFDVRLSLVSTIYGEKACMRLLEKSNNIGKIDRLGFLTEQAPIFERMIKRPHGLVLVTGPTGSGKSTTLYAALQRINSPGINISTVEDPVEFKLKGVNQIQVNPRIGVNFATGLRTLVRQDPDVILVGEIRDKETAEIAIQAALTGHLVLSTLHTNDAAGAIVRLQNMGIEPFLISAAVIGVVGQRLLRMVCPNCRETYYPTEEMCKALGISILEEGIPAMVRGTGCKRCNGRGSKGRTAVMEIMPVTEHLKAMILKEASSADLADAAIDEGLITMRQAAVMKARAFEVTPEEILRVFAEDDSQ